MAVSAPHDPPIGAGHAASPLQPDSRTTNAVAPYLAPHACVRIRFVPENKTTVPGVVSSKLREFEPKDTVTRRIEAVEVATEVWSEKSELMLASRTAVPAEN
jgi:hypothetical protein